MSEGFEGALYVVATPIGNLEDLSPRATRVLGEVDWIAAEDTRHSARLLRPLGIDKPLVSLHEHNEQMRVETLRQALDTGKNVALISDAGTPLISDPGYVVVRELRASGHRVIPVPGACALITALSAAGLATNRFLFEGFLPAKGGPRRQRLMEGREREETLVYYESPHRIQATLQDIAALFGTRRVVLARELTKTFETFLDADAETLGRRMQEDPNQARGEFVIMVAGAAPPDDETHALAEGEAWLAAMLAEGVGVKAAATVVAGRLGGRKKYWYQCAQALKDGDG
ncbi:16S rRNA (cytidine1402-2'-O)-methyltransferase [Chromohalobacter marismortui]|uniref:Ribosomal RNA small subunit methyltransferase I n=1 Tax=Chromohalobacter marismortui TaxID=42055 RepID=A0A4R7NR56_9GAMM|nr:MULTISPECIES: 16S rRNA (cytidine(1402)-2'-O)-methyltransferase [Chromohalobacter]MCI0508532.1 16S rRNA (cytidine(1402)-2'-O)-methyltransferase [Chromohalobacter sp.]MCI0592177.1 16S rRNA (cytidine(1402)-2'-O)-methyltransferase [Chromohalobacter sp.]TDU23011.1 16S rRNA (cytidine1402-2'-O)-methyltransferase [Chromohalobacter marismortui]